MKLCLLILSEWWHCVRKLIDSPLHAFKLSSLIGVLRCEQIFHQHVKLDSRYSLQPCRHACQHKTNSSTQLMATCCSQKNHHLGFEQILAVLMYQPCVTTPQRGSLQQCQSCQWVWQRCSGPLLWLPQQRSQPHCQSCQWVLQRCPETLLLLLQRMTHVASERRKWCSCPGHWWLHVAAKV